MRAETERMKAQLPNNHQEDELMPCPHCGAPITQQMRFCRLCGFRLGEGLAEYVETVRLPNAPSVGSAPNRASAGSAQANPFEVNEWGALGRPLGNQAAVFDPASTNIGTLKKRRHWFPQWLVWIIIINIALSVVVGGFILSFSDNGRDPTRIGRRSGSTRSYVGVKNFESTAGGVMFDVVTPNGPADQAGLIGGDIVTSIDGQAVKDSDDLIRVLGSVTVGKTVDVIFIRDGETKQTKMTTISQEEWERIDDLEDDRENKGYLGVDKLERVPVEGMKIYGMRLGRVIRNRPAYISGLREGDIVIEFNGTPIRTDREFRSRINRATPDSTVKVIVMRGGERLEIPVKVGIDD